MQRHLARDGSPRTEGGSSCGSRYGNTEYFEMFEITCWYNAKTDHFFAK